MGNRRNYLAQHIPEFVESGIVGAVLDVAELVEHRVEDLLEGEEIPIPVGPPQAKLHLGAAPNI